MVFINDWFMLKRTQMPKRAFFARVDDGALNSECLWKRFFVCYHSLTWLTLTFGPAEPSSRLEASLA